ncbi:MAG: hypothetical protein ACI39H_03565 [Lachnospiraceae bacterium]
MKQPEKMETGKDAYMEQAENCYLSQKQLCELVAQVEEQELISAPGDFLAGVLHKMEEKEQMSQTAKKQKTPKEGKILEFRRYCIRVVTSAVAAIALVFLLPGFGNAQREEQLVKQTIVSQQKPEGMMHQEEESLTEKIGSCRVIRDGELLTIIKKLGGK